MQYLSTFFIAALSALLTIAPPAPAAAENEVALPGDRAYPESVTAGPDGTLYVSSLASGGVYRIKPGSATAEEWIKPGAFETRVTFGLAVDSKAKMLWVCSNDISSLGVPGPSDVTGSYVKGFDLETGEGKVSAELPNSPSICNDIAIGDDGSLYVANSLAPQILKLKPGGTKLEVWLESEVIEQPKEGAGLDGIAFGGDGNLYVNTYMNGGFYRIEVKDGEAGKVTKLTPSRELKFPDALRSAGGLDFYMAEGGGTVDRVTVKGDAIDIETIKSGLAGPTSIVKVGSTLWVSEGQLSHLFDPKAGPPQLPFRILGIPAE